MKGAILEQRAIKDEILDFVLNSSEEENSKIAFFIAGMRAQKKLPDYRQKTGKGTRTANKDAVAGVKICPAGK